MKILILSWRDSKHPQAGGAEQVVDEHAKAWQKAGNKITFFSSRFVGSKDHEVEKGFEYFHRGDQYIGVKFEAFKFWIKNKERYDLVIDQFHGIPFFTPLFVKKPKLAILQELARNVWFLNGFPWPISWIVGVFGYVFEPLIFILYKKVPFMVGSLSAKKELVQVGINKNYISIVPHGVIINPTKKSYPKEKIKTLVFLGALTKDKGIEDAISVFSILNKKGNYKFWIIGRGSKEYQSILANLVKKNGIKDNTTFWGYVDDSKKFSLLEKSHLLINPSIREGWGLVNIEANYFGTPVVAYKSPGLIDSVKEGESGIFCKNNPESMALAVENLLNDNRRYSLLSKSSKKWSQNFDWKKSGRISLSLIERITKK